MASRTRLVLLSYSFCLTRQVLGQTLPLDIPANVALDILRGKVGAYTASEIDKLTATASPGVSYPVGIPRLPDDFSFSCSQIHQPGYYADMDYSCQIYHRCENNMPLYSYLCPEGKLFNQIILNCDWWYNVQCEKSGQFYDYSNPRLYLGPNVTFLNNAPENATTKPIRQVALMTADQFAARSTKFETFANSASRAANSRLEARNIEPPQTSDPKPTSEPVRYTGDGSKALVPFRKSENKQKDDGQKSVDHRSALSNLFASKTIRRIPGANVRPASYGARPQVSTSSPAVDGDRWPDPVTMAPKITQTAPRFTQQVIQNTDWMDQAAREMGPNKRRANIEPPAVSQPTLRHSALPTRPVQPATVSMSQYPGASFPLTSQPKLVDYDDSETGMEAQRGKRPLESVDAVFPLSNTETPRFQPEMSRAQAVSEPQPNWIQVSDPNSQSNIRDRTNIAPAVFGPSHEYPGQFANHYDRQSDQIQLPRSDEYALPSQYSPPQYQPVDRNGPLWQSDGYAQNNLNLNQPRSSPPSSVYEINLASQNTFNQPSSSIPDPHWEAGVDWITDPSTQTLPTTPIIPITETPSPQSDNVWTSTETNQPLGGMFNLFSGEMSKPTNVEPAASSDNSRTWSLMYPGDQAAGSMPDKPVDDQQQEDNLVQKLQFAHSNSSDETLAADGYWQSDGTWS